MLTLADGNGAGVPGRGFKSAGFENFERMWTGQQVRARLLICNCADVLLWGCDDSMASKWLTSSYSRPPAIVQPWLVDKHRDTATMCCTIPSCRCCLR
jgi:hypothetical protein